MKLAEESARTGEPIVKSMEFVYPNQGFSDIKNQFCLVNEMMVALKVEKGKTQRKVVLTKGKRLADMGKVMSADKLIQ